MRGPQAISNGVLKRLGADPMARRTRAPISLQQPARYRGTSHARRGLEARTRRLRDYSLPGGWCCCDGLALANAVGPSDPTEPLLPIPEMNRRLLQDATHPEVGATPLDEKGEAWRATSARCTASRRSRAVLVLAPARPPTATPVVVLLRRISRRN